VVTGHQLTVGSDAVQVQSDVSTVNGISVRDNDITVKGVRRMGHRHPVVRQ
jgi:hypothetical protein